MVTEEKPTVVETDSHLTYTTEIFSTTKTSNQLVNEASLDFIHIINRPNCSREVKNEMGTSRTKKLETYFSLVFIVFNIETSK